MSISISPVEIDIADEKRFADVAFLIDREDFLADMQELRKKFSKYQKLPLLSPPPKKHWFAFPWSSTSLQAQAHAKAIEPIEEIAFNLNKTMDMSIEEKEELSKNYEYAMRLLPQNDFRFSIRDLRRRYKRPANFDRIIAHAVLYNKVQDEDYITAEASVKYPELEFPQYFDDEQITVVLYPGFNLDDAKKLLQKDIPVLMKEHQGKYITIETFEFDVKPEIKRHRKWYWWRKQEKLGWILLGRKVTDEEQTFVSQETVRDAVNRYKDKLTMKI